MTALMMTMMQTSSESQKHDKDAVYSNAVLYQLMNALNSETISNDLRSLKAYLEKQMDREISDTELYEYVTAIVYTYNVTVNAYSTDANGEYVKADMSSLFTSLMGSMMGSSDFASSLSGMSSMSNSGMQLWEQMLAPAPSEDSGPAGRSHDR